MMAQPVIAARGLTPGLRRDQGAQPRDIAVRPAIVHGLIGPNGSGKKHVCVNVLTGSLSAERRRAV